MTASAPPCVGRLHGVLAVLPSAQIASVAHARLGQSFPRYDHDWKRFRLSKRKRGGQRKTEVPPKQTAQEGIRAGANKAASARPRATSSLTFVWWSGGVLLVALLVA